MSSLAVAKAVLAAAVANNQTVAIPYPAGFTQAFLIGSTGGSLAVNNNDRFPQAPSGAGTVAFAFGADTITITNNSGVTWPVGAELIVGFGDSQIGGTYNPRIRQMPALVALIAATGTASNTINDVGGAFNQATLNNNFKSQADKLNEVIAAVRQAGINV